MNADFYVCPNCLYFEFGDEVEDIKACPRCGGKILAVNASMEAQHLLTDIWEDHGGDFTTIAAIALAILDYPTLSVEVKAEEPLNEAEEPLNEDVLVEILKKNDKVTRLVLEILKDQIAPVKPIDDLVGRLQIA